MEYIKMTLEEANKYCSKNKTVLVSVQDLEKDNEVISFVRQNAEDCKKIMENAATIGKICDDFIEQLRVFSHKQMDLIHYRPEGTMHTILFQKDGKN